LTYDPIPTTINTFPVIRKSFLLLAFALLGATALQAQQDNARYTGTMERLIEQMNGAFSESETDGEALLQAANGFERVAKAEPGEWLPCYYAAYCHVMRSFSLPDATVVDPVLDQADGLLEQADALSPENSEILVLQSMAASARIRVDFNRGMTMGPKASGLATKATRIEAANPRGWMQLGQQLLFTPEQFGGGAGRGCPLLQKAADRYASFEPASALHPNWGQEYNAALMAQYCTASESSDEEGQ
jgi:hypothetical protein